jgi:hypothetical protein
VRSAVKHTAMLYRDHTSPWKSATVRLAILGVVFVDDTLVQGSRVCNDAKLEEVEGAAGSVRAGRAVPIFVQTCGSFAPALASNASYPV